MPWTGPPELLIGSVLDRLRNPHELLQLISLVLEKGTTFLQGAGHTVFQTTHGVKQRCLSSLLFHYVDDIAGLSPKGPSSRTSAMVRHALNLITCQLNVTKSESLPTVLPREPSLSQYLHPPAGCMDFRQCDGLI